MRIEEVVTEFQDFPLDEGQWSADTAVSRVREWAGGPEKEDIDWSKYAKAFMWHDPDEPEKFGSYKLPYVDVRNGRARAVWSAITNIRARLGQTNIPEGDKDTVRNHIQRYYEKHGTEWEETTKPYQHREQMRETGGRIMEADDSRRDWPVVIAEAGMTEDGARYYPEETLQRAVEEQKFSGSKMYVNHGLDSDWEQRGHRDLDEWVAVVRKGSVRYDEAAQAVRGTAHVHEENFAKVLQDDEAREALGLSHDSFVVYHSAQIDGQERNVVEDITENISVDFVPDANTRGRIQAALKSDAPGTNTHTDYTTSQEVDEMQYDELTIDDIRENRPDLAEELTDEGEQETDGEVGELKEKVKELERERDVSQTQELVRRELEGYDTLDTVRSHVLDRFEGEVIAPGEISDEVDEAVEAERRHAREVLQEAGAEAQVRGLGESEAPDGEGEDETPDGEAYENMLRERQAQSMTSDQLEAQKKAVSEG